MTKRVLDWNSVANVNFDDNRRKKHGNMTGKELFAKAHETLQKAEDNATLTKAMEPILKAKLVEYMMARKPLTVLAPFHNPTEALNGIQKSEVEEEDDFYYSGGQSRDPSTSTASATFQEVMETIPAGTELVFKSLDKQLGQFIFKGSNGHEYAIYTQPEVMFQNSTIKNPGYFGLLFNTQLRNELGE